MSTSSMTAAMTMAASVASGSFSNSPVSNSNVTRVSTAAVVPESCDRAPALPLTAVFDRLPLTTMPLVRPAPTLAAPEPQQLAVGVDVVALTGGVGLGGPQTLGEADEHHADRGTEQLEVVGAG